MVPHTKSPVPELFRCAADGDADAWRELVTHMEPRLRRQLRGYRLGRADIEDLLQETWVQALLHLGTVRDHEAAAGWLYTIARRQAFRRLQRITREVPVEDFADTHDPLAEPLSELVIGHEQSEALRRAVARLTVRQRELLHALLNAPDPSYTAIAQALGMPVGSIGPTRERAINALRADPELCGAIA